MRTINQKPQIKTNKIVWIISCFIFCFPLSANSQSENFDSFIVEFCNDSCFQMSRVKFPLQYLSWDYETDKEITIQIQKEDYTFDRLFCDDYSDAYTIFYDNFNCKFRNTGQMVFRWRGFTDMDRRYYFKRIKGRWFLIKILDYDPI